MHMVEKSCTANQFLWITVTNVYLWRAAHLKNALQRDAKGNITFKTADGKKNANTGWKYGKDGLMDGCTYNWAWYTTDAQAGKFDYKKVYSYFHNGTDSVMALMAVS